MATLAGWLAVSAVGVFPSRELYRSRRARSNLAPLFPATEKTGYSHPVLKVRYEATVAVESIVQVVLHSVCSELFSSLYANLAQNKFWVTLILDWLKFDSFVTPGQTMIV
jgi:hypothetical protein